MIFMRLVMSPVQMTYFSLLPNDEDLFEFEIINRIKEDYDLFHKPKRSV